MEILVPAASKIFLAQATMAVQSESFATRACAEFTVNQTENVAVMKSVKMEDAEKSAVRTATVLTSSAVSLETVNHSTDASQTLSVPKTKFANPATEDMTVVEIPARTFSVGETPCAFQTSTVLFVSVLKVTLAIRWTKGWAASKLTASSTKTVVPTESATSINVLIPA